MLSVPCEIITLIANCSDALRAFSLRYACKTMYYAIPAPPASAAISILSSAAFDAPIPVIEWLHSMGIKYKKIKNHPNICNIITYAVKGGRFNVFKSLIHQHFPRDATSYVYLAYSRNAGILKTLYNYAKRNEEYFNAYDTITLAAAIGNHTIVDYMIKNIYTKKYCGPLLLRTLLGVAAAACECSMLRYLLHQLGSDGYDAFALYIARYNGHYDTVKKYFKLHTRIDVLGAISCMKNKDFPHSFWLVNVKHAIDEFDVKSPNFILNKYPL